MIPTPALPEMFLCDRLKMRLTTAGCGKLHASTLSRPPEPSEGRHHCVTCPIGARNAGIVMSPVAPVVERLRRICPRCFRSAQRLIRNELCVSCYNRDGEARRGRNAKGNPPAIAALLHSRPILVTPGGWDIAVQSYTVLTLREGLIAAAKQATGPLAFARAFMLPPRPVARQQSLGLPVPYVPRSVVRRARLPRMSVDQAPLW